MKHILITCPNMIMSMDRFFDVFEHYKVSVHIPPVNERMSEEEILEFAGTFDGIISGDDRFTERVMKACLPRLKVITKWGTGIDSIDKAAAAKLGIQLYNTPNAFTMPVADSVMAYMLAFARQQPWMDKAIKSGTWKKRLSRSLSECALGVIGVGNIGKAVIRRARPFGMRILGNDIAPIAPDFIIEQGVEMMSLYDLAAQADFITVNCDLNPTSEKLVNAVFLDNVQPHAVLINTARGPIVDEKALVKALQEEHLAGAGLDVFEDEPIPADSPLLKMDNVILGSHNSNNSPAAWERVHWNSIHMLLKGLDIPHDDLDQIKKEKGLYV